MESFETAFRKEANMIELEVLKHLGPFSRLNQAQLSKLQPKCEEIEFKAGDKLFTEGDDARHLWVVKKGGVDLRFELPDRSPTSGQMTVDSFEVEEKEPEAKVFGWSCFVPPYRMRLSAYCITRTCNIIRIPKPDLVKLFDEDPRIGYLFMSYMIQVVGYRFQQFRDHVAKNMGEDLMFGW